MGADSGQSPPDRAHPLNLPDEWEGPLKKKTPKEFLNGRIAPPGNYSGTSCMLSITTTSTSWVFGSTSLWPPPGCTVYSSQQ